MSGFLWGFFLIVLAIFVWLYWMWKISKGDRI